MSPDIIRTPWDSTVFGLPTYEIIYKSNEQLEQLINSIVKSKKMGHYTVKINPTSSKDILHKFGFYYCDSLIEPFCERKNFIPYFCDDVSLSQKISFKKIESICHNTFSYGRFQRDFNIPQSLADKRYVNWLKDLWDKQQVFGLIYQDEVVGFFAFSQNNILLHALNQSSRGKGLSKFFWSHACQTIYEQGFTELTSSISACNLAVLNLYTSLGFKFRNPVDVYHWLYQ